MSHPTAETTSPAVVRQVLLDAGEVRLSALLAEPGHGATPRATVVALHGGGMRAGYFHAPADRRLSFLGLAAGLGYRVLAVDRPGYGHSAAVFPEGLPLADQCDLLRRALADRQAGGAADGAGLFLLAHSYGGKAALTLAADPGGLPLIGAAVSGIGHRIATALPAPGTVAWARELGRNNWGPLGLYPPDTFRLAAPLVAPMPAREAAEVPRWTRALEGLAPRIGIPVRFTFAEHEHRWRHDPEALADLTALFRGAPAGAAVSIDGQPGAGHNISLGWAARPYHLRVLGFLEDCLLRMRTPAAAA
ncbi:alpha/beta fold hydrolase [Streptomyces sp. NPDC007369]|uniref:alpha/beta fold hydrolase n=1 Tax=Streptomyces sp. NPDC007369 TaxID=3154589 RepID=UPI0033C6396B